MEKCFHRQCDDYENIQEPQNSLKFLSEVTQALVLTVFELTMPQGSSCKHEVKTDDVNEVLTTELVEIIGNGIEDRVDSNLVVTDEDNDDIGNENFITAVENWDEKESVKQRKKFAKDFSNITSIDRRRAN